MLELSLLLFLQNYNSKTFFFHECSLLCDLRFISSQHVNMGAKNYYLDFVMSYVRTYGQSIII